MQEADGFRGAAWTPDGRVILGSRPERAPRYAASGGSEFEPITRPELTSSHAAAGSDTRWARFAL